MRRMLGALAALLVAAAAPAQAQRPAGPAELEQMLAPVALYPDPLLSQVLMAAAHPEDLAEAARWSRAHPYLRGEPAIDALPAVSWDPSVQSLAAFPEVLQWLAEHPAWTRALGEAFRDQPPRVMDAVQRLRARALAAGHLASDRHVVVRQQGAAISLLPADSGVLHVPYYDTAVFHVVRTAPVFISWGVPCVIAPHLLFGRFDWRERRHARATFAGHLHPAPRHRPTAAPVQVPVFPSAPVAPVQAPLIPYWHVPIVQHRAAPVVRPVPMAQPLPPAATLVGRPNPFATQGGRPDPFASQGGRPNPFATQGGRPPADLRR